jgi:hypothetical protein
VVAASAETQPSHFEPCLSMPDGVTTKNAVLMSLLSAQYLKSDVVDLPSLPMEGADSGVE